MSTKKGFSRILAFALALIMMFSLVPIQSFAATIEVPAAELTLKDGQTVAISNDMTADQIKRILFDALVKDPANADYSDYEWEVLGTSRSSPALNTEQGWVDFIAGGEWYTKHAAITYHYTVKPVKDSGDASYKVRLKGNTQEVTVKKVSSATVSYTYDSTMGTVETNAQKVPATAQVSPSKEYTFTVKPGEGYKVANVKVNGKELNSTDGTYTIVPVAQTNIEVVFAEDGTFYDINFIPTEGVTVKLDGREVNGNVRVAAKRTYKLEYVPADNMSIYKVRLADEDITANVAFKNYVGTQDIVFTKAADFKVEAVNVNNEVVLNAERNIPIAITADGKFDFAGIRANLIDVLIDKNASVNTEFSANTVEFQHYTPYYTAGGVVGVSSDWVALEGVPANWAGVYYNPIHSGNNKIRMRFKGNDQFKATSFVELNVNFVDAKRAEIVLKQNPQVTIQETKVNEFDYSHLNEDIFKAAIDAEASTPNLVFSDLTFNVPANITKSGVYKVTATYKGTISYYKSDVTFDLNVNVNYLPKANIVLNKSEADLVLNETNVGVFDNAALKKAAFDALINKEECQRAGLDVSKINMELQDVTEDGTYTVKFSYAATDVLHANEVTAKVNVTVNRCPRVSLKIGSNTTATLYKNYDGSWNYEDLKDQIFALLTVEGVNDLARQDFNFEYLLKQGGAVFIGQNKYYPFEQGQLGADPTGSGVYLNRAGKFQIRVSIPTTQDYYGCEYVFEVNVKTDDNYTAQIIANDGQPYNLVLNKTKDGKWNYDDLKEQVFKAAVKEVKNTQGTFKYTDFNYQYDVLDAMGTHTGADTGFRNFEFTTGWDTAETYKYLYKGGQFDVKIILPALDGIYHGTELVVKVNLATNDPYKSTIKVNDSIPEFTLTETTVGVFDTETLKREIFEKAINFAASTPNNMKYEEMEIVLPEITKSGNYPVTVKFNGNFDYNASSVTFNAQINTVELPTANIVLSKDIVAAQLNETKVNVFDMDALKREIFEKAVDAKASAPKLTYNDVEITFDREIAKSGKYTATIAYKQTDKVHPSSVQLTADITVNELAHVEIATQHRVVTLNKKLDNTWNYEGLKKEIFEQCLKVTGVDNLTYDKFNYQYFLRQGGAVFVGQKDWYSFEQAQLGADPTSSGVYLWKGGKDFEIKVSIPDSSTYHGAEVTVKVDVELNDPYYTEIVLKPNYEKNFVLNYNAQGKYDYNRLKKDIFNAVIDAEKNNANTKFENVVFKYQILNGLGVDDSKLPGGLSGHYYDFEQQWLDCDAAGTYRYLYKGGNFNVKMIIPASETTRETSVIVNVNVAVAERLAANVVLKDVKTPYSTDSKEIKQAIFNTIDLPASKLPQNVTVDDFVYEYYTINYTAGDIPGVEHWWVPVEGMKHPSLVGSYFKPIQVGNYAVRVRYRGNEEYNVAESNEAKITVTGRDFDISFTKDSIYLDENIPAGYIEPSIKDNFTKFEIFASLDDKTQTTIYIDTEKGLNKELAFAGNVPFNSVLLKVFGVDVVLSADEVYYRRGLSRQELETLVAHPAFIEYMQYHHNINSKACEAIAAQVKALPAEITHIWFKIGQPKTPGTYRALGIAALKNYNTATATQTFYVRFHSKGTKLVWWQDTANLNVFTAKNFDFRAVLTKNGVPINSDHVKYIYTGFRSNFRFYGSTKNPPRGAGIYTQTAYTGIKGKYAFPKTRTFVIGL